LAHHQYFWNNGKIIEISSTFFENSRVVMLPFTRNLLELAMKGRPITQ
jgi:hypothetical protein